MALLRFSNLSLNAPLHLKQSASSRWSLCWRQQQQWGIGTDGGWGGQRCDRVGKTGGGSKRKRKRESETVMLNDLSASWVFWIIFGLRFFVFCLHVGIRKRCNCRNLSTAAAAAAAYFFSTLTKKEKKKVLFNSGLVAGRFPSQSEQLPRVLVPVGVHSFSAGYVTFSFFFRLLEPLQYFSFLNCIALAVITLTCCSTDSTFGDIFLTTQTTFLYLLHYTSIWICCCCWFVVVVLTT